MSLVGGLLLLPFAGPAWAFRLFVERMRDEAEAQMYDEGRVFAELVQLSVRRNAGELSDAEYAEHEAALLERVSAIRQHQEDVLNAEMGEYEDDESIDAELDVDEEWTDVDERVGEEHP